MAEEEEKKRRNGEKEVTEEKRLWLIELVKLVKEQLLQCRVDFYYPSVSLQSQDPLLSERDQTE